MAVRLGASVDRVVAKSATNEELEVRLSTGETMRADTVLFATGRRPNTDGLGLEAAGVSVDARGKVLVDEQFRTTAEGVYAAGDVLGATLASVAMEQGRAAVCHAFGIPFEGTVDPTPVSAIYGMPEIAGAGLTEQQCEERGLDYAVGRADLALTPRGAIAGRGGLLKLIFRKDDHALLGAHAICDIASEVVGIGQMAIRCRATLHTLMNMSMSTPTYSYAYKYAAFDGLKRVGVADAKRRMATVTSPRKKEREHAT
jgi:NAD(P) transhydrogenase